MLVDDRSDMTGQNDIYLPQSEACNESDLRFLRDLVLLIDISLCENSFLEYPADALPEH